MFNYVFEVIFDNGHNDTFTAIAKNYERAIELLRGEIDVCIDDAEVVDYYLVEKFDIS